jgi:hypothetical protein
MVKKELAVEFGYAGMQPENDSAGFSRLIMAL